MSDASTPRLTPRFQAGGTLRPEALYVERSSDTELLEALLTGEFCYVLATRQIGKSSLCRRTVEKMQTRDVQTVTIDLTQIGGQGSTRPEWYFGLVQQIALDLHWQGDPSDFWAHHKDTTPVHRLTLFLRQLVMSPALRRLVIFIDEIDSVRALSFETDDFFAAIRAIYNLRAREPAYEKLTFCLLGVAAPEELIRDPLRTPFNIGRGVRLRDFSNTEAQALLPGLAVLPGDQRDCLLRILSWTSGHPYMTQKLCSIIVERYASSTVDNYEKVVDALVAETFLGGDGREDSNLIQAQARLEKHPRVGEMLRLYQRLLAEPEPLQLDDELQRALLLTGMVAEEEKDGRSFLRVRNRIFATVFNVGFVKAQQERRLIDEPLGRWLEAARDPKLLLTGIELERAQKWARGKTNLDLEASEFLRASIEKASTLLSEQLQTLQNQAQLTTTGANNKIPRQILLVVFAGFIAPMSTLIYFTLYNKKNVTWDTAIPVFCVLLAAWYSFSLINRYRLQLLMHSEEPRRREIIANQSFQKEGLLHEILAQRPSHAESIYRVITIGLPGSGKTALTLKWANPLVHLDQLKPTEFNAYERIVSRQRTKDGKIIDHIFQIRDWGGKFIADSHAELVTLGSEIHAILLVVDLSLRSWQPDQSPQTMLGADIVRINTQLEEFSVNALRFFFAPRTLTNCRTFVLFINKSDCLPGSPSVVEARAMELYKPLIDSLRQLAHNRGVNIKIFVGSAATGHNTHHLFAHLIESVLPEDAYDEQLLHYFEHARPDRSLLQSD